MSTSGPTLLPAFFSTDADFRSWAQGVHDKIVGVGLVQTADTGQINFSTVTKPGAANTAAGYAIYRFDDALQATLPVFIKMEYGTGGAVDRPGTWITVGSSTNGSGTLSGGSARKQISPSQSKTAGTTLDTYCSGTSSRLSLVTNYDPAGTTAFAMGHFVERLRTPAGVETADGVLIYSTAQNVMLFQVMHASGATTAIQTTTHPFFLDATKLQTSFGGNIALVGAHIPLGTWYRALPCSGDAAVLTSGASLTITNLGSNRTILPLVNLFKLAGTIFCMPWE